MRAVIQRVANASVEVENTIKGRIDAGLLVLLGVEPSDTVAEVKWLAQKIVNMRIFSDENGLMNKSVLESSGNVLLISQFTLFALTQKGNRPSFINAAKPELAIELYEEMIRELNLLMGKEIEHGVFGADMKVSLLNDGPVTIIMDTNDKARH
jgi:D-tyrosyl-tRNA(Tyr) deacylase